MRHKRLGCPGPASGSSLDRVEIVLLHGNSSSSRCWRRLAAADVLRGHELVAIDLPGHGGGPYAEHVDYSLRGLARSVAALSQARPLASRVVVGWSLGGHVALEAAASIPGLAGLVLIGAPPTGFPVSGFRAMPAAATCPYPPAHRVREHIETLCRDESARLLFRDDYSLADPRVREGVARCIASGDFSDEIEIVRGRLPVGVVVGADDPLVDLDHLRSVPWGHLWGGRVHLIEGALHAPHADAPDAVASLVSGFVASIRSASSIPSQGSPP